MEETHQICSETGVVDSVDDKNGFAYVNVERKSDCENCRACIFGRKQKLCIKTVNDASAHRGDNVRVEMSHGGKNALISTVIVFVLPLVFLFAALFAGILAHLVEWLTVVIALGAVVLSMAVVAFIDKALSRSSLAARTVQILPPAQTPQENLTAAVSTAQAE